MLNWCNRFNICAFLDNHQYNLQAHSYECLAGCGAYMQLTSGAGSAFEKLDAFMKEGGDDWYFGHFSYDLKAETEQVPSLHDDYTGFPDLCFFIPQVVLQLSSAELRIGVRTGDPESIWNEIRTMEVTTAHLPSQLQLRERVTREAYLHTIEQVQQHIVRGDCYELNYCMEFYAEQAVLDPVSVYRQLVQVSPNPFSAFYKAGDSYLLCASPERFLCKRGSKLLSQPIKGTAARQPDDTVADELFRQTLSASQKERSENVMVVDLVRNDLSRICTRGSVQVEELFGIYSFPQVHQMISTVSGEVQPGLSIAEMIKATFPMGSMTGAPKRRVLELTEVYEKSRRGIFSGAVGYVSPGGDFDFNVVIRSIMYNAAASYVSYMVGSGITWYANAAEEYEECLLKAKAIAKVLGGSVS